MSLNASTLSASMKACSAPGDVQRERRRAGADGERPECARVLRRREEEGARPDVRADRVRLFQAELGGERHDELGHRTRAHEVAATLRLTEPREIHRHQREIVLEVRPHRGVGVDALRPRAEQQHGRGAGRGTRHEPKLEAVVGGEFRFEGHLRIVTGDDLRAHRALAPFCSGTVLGRRSAGLGEEGVHVGREPAGVLEEEAGAESGYVMSRTSGSRPASRCE